MCLCIICRSNVIDLLNLPEVLLRKPCKIRYDYSVISTDTNREAGLQCNHHDCRTYCKSKYTRTVGVLWAGCLCDGVHTVLLRTVSHIHNYTAHTYKKHDTRTSRSIILYVSWAITLMVSPGMHILLYVLNSTAVV